MSQLYSCPDILYNLELTREELSALRETMEWFNQDYLSEAQKSIVGKLERA